jgi:hypothetical protein
LLIKKSSEVVSFAQLKAPLSETEWKKLSSSAMSSASNSAIGQQAQSQTANKKSNLINEPTTTVNPRERPKANLNAINNIIPLANNAANICNKTASKQQVAQQAQSKLSVSIKPSVATSSLSTNQFDKNDQQPLGFDDDFNIAQSVPISSVATVSPSQAEPFVDNGSQQYLQQPVVQSSSQSSLGEKKAHRRSASQ